MNKELLSLLFSDIDGLYYWHKNVNNQFAKKYIVSFKHNDLINAVNSISDTRFNDLN